MSNSHSENGTAQRQVVLKRTPLYEVHCSYGARIIEFAGWQMPVQYSSIQEEHLAVRSSAGLFDISHMGQLNVSGDGAAEFLNYLLTNDINKLAVGDAQYSLMCNERGGVIDDLYVYRIEPKKFLIIVNASRAKADLRHFFQQLNKHPAGKKTTIEFIAENAGAVAVQGALVPTFINFALDGVAAGGACVKKPDELKRNQIAYFVANNKKYWVARTGYTGEDGFEVFAKGADIVKVWKSINEVGAEYSLRPAGLGARDTLRLEACYPLYGNELDENTTPIEAGLGYFLCFEKDFIGAEPLKRQKLEGVRKKSIAFKMLEKSPVPRHNCAIFNENNDAIGIVTSGTHSPMLNVGIGLGYVSPQWSAIGTKLKIDIRGKQFWAEIVKKPFYKNPNLIK